MRCVVSCGSPSFPWLKLGNVDMLQPVSLSGRRRSEDWKPSTFEWKAAQIFATSFLIMAIKSTNYKDENTGNSFRITPSNHTGRTRTNAVGLHITKKLLTNYVHLTVFLNPIKLADRRLNFKYFSCQYFEECVSHASFSFFPFSLQI